MRLESTALAIVAALLAAPAQAGNCPVWGEFARMVMTMHQEGHDIEEPLYVVMQMHIREERMFAESIVFTAYEYPRERSPHTQQQVSQHYGQRVWDLCAEAVDQY